MRKKKRKESYVFERYRTGTMIEETISSHVKKRKLDFRVVENIVGTSQKLI